MLTSSKARRGGDSNPRRRDCRRNGFRDRRIQPLCHLSVAECIHPAPPLQPHLTLYNRVPQPCISTSSLFQRHGSSRSPPTNLDQQSLHLETRALQILVLCEVRSDRMDLPVRYATLTMYFRKMLSVRRCASEVTSVRKSDPATITAVHGGIGQADTSTRGYLRFCQKGFQKGPGKSGSRDLWPGLSGRW